MPDKNIDYQTELDSIMDNLAESVLDTTDEEITQETEDHNNSPERVKQILLGAVKNCRQQSLREARKRYLENSQSLQQKKYRIPETPKEMRNLLLSLTAQNSFLNDGSQLTAQFRDFNDLPDEDLESYLQQLFALGVFEEHDNQGEDNQ